MAEYNFLMIFDQVTVTRSLGQLGHCVWPSYHLQSLVPIQHPSIIKCHHMSYISFVVKLTNRRRKYLNVQVI